MLRIYLSTNSSLFITAEATSVPAVVVTLATSTPMRLYSRENYLPSLVQVDGPGDEDEDENDDEDEASLFLSPTIL